MRFYILFTIYFLLVNSVSAQQVKDLAGEYYLTGVMETASGLKLNPDSTFEFFYAYGALDRTGGGKWSIDGNSVILNSYPSPGPVFKLIKSEKRSGKSMMFRLVEQNTMLKRYFMIALLKDSKAEQLEADDEGLVTFQPQDYDSLGLVFTLCPDRAFAVDYPDNGNNYFEYSLEPWITDVIFDHLRYTLTDNNLQGPHPLLKPGEYLFINEKN